MSLDKAARGSGAARLSFAPPPALAGSSSSAARGRVLISPTDCCRRTTSPPVAPFKTGAPPDHCRGYVPPGPTSGRLLPSDYVPINRVLSRHDRWLRLSPPIMLRPPPPSSWACNVCCTRRRLVVRLLIWVSSSPLARDSSWSRTALRAASRPHSRSVTTRPSRHVSVSVSVSVTARLHPGHHSSRLTSAVQRHWTATAK